MTAIHPRQSTTTALALDVQSISPAGFASKALTRAGTTSLGEAEPGVFVVDVRNGLPSLGEAEDAVRRFLLAAALGAHRTQQAVAGALGLTQGSVSREMIRLGLRSERRPPAVARPSKRTAAFLAAAVLVHIAPEPVGLEVVEPPRSCGSCRARLADPAATYCDDRCERAARVYAMRATWHGRGRSVGNV